MTDDWFPTELVVHRLHRLLGDLLGDKACLCVKAPGQRRATEPIVVLRLPQPELAVGRLHARRRIAVKPRGLPVRALLDSVA